MALEARYAKQNTSTLPFKFPTSSNIGNRFLPPNRHPRADFPSTCASVVLVSDSLHNNTRTRHTIEIAPKFVDRYHVPLPSICQQLLLHTLNAIFIKRFQIFLLCGVDCRVWKNWPVLFVRIYRTNMSSKNF